MKKEKKYIKLKYPFNSNEELNLVFKTDFYTVSPKYWDGSGIKFDNDQHIFYGLIPGTVIPSALIGTGFYVAEKYYDYPEVNTFIDKTFSLYPLKIKADFEHDLALSFAGEDRKIIELIANNLKKNNANVFYDYFFKAEMVGKDLSNYFKEKYGYRSKYVVIFISKYYSIKDWANFEFEIARDEAKHRKEEFIIPVRLDDTNILGLKSTIGYIDFKKEGIEGTVKILLKKIKITSS